MIMGLWFPMPVNRKTVLFGKTTQKLALLGSKELRMCTNFTVAILIWPAEYTAKPFLNTGRNYSKELYSTVAEVIKKPPVTNSGI